MDNKRVNREEDIDLSSMINEYSQDNELRKKIEEVKKKKEEERKLYEAKQQSESIFDNISYTGTFIRPETEKPNTFSGIRADDTLTNASAGVDDSDKTLVIMNNKTKVSLLEETQSSGVHHTTVFSAEDVHDYADTEDVEGLYDEEEEFVEEKKQKGKSMRNSSLEEDDDEDEESNERMNRVITYVIIGIVGIFIVIGAFFGVKYAMNNFLGGSDTPVQEEEKQTEEPKQEENQPNEEEQPEDDEKENIQTNQAEAARLKKQLEQYETQLDDVEKQLEEAQKAVDAAQVEIDSFESLKNKAYALQDQANEVQGLLTKVNELDAFKNSADPEEKGKYDVAYNAYKATCEKYGVADYNEIYQASVAKNKEFNDNAQAAGQKKRDAETKRDGLKTRKQELEVKIADTTTELSQYEN